MVRPTDSCGLATPHYDGVPRGYPSTEAEFLKEATGGQTDYLKVTIINTDYF